MTLTDFPLARIAEDEARDLAYDIGAGVIGPNDAQRWRAECKARLGLRCRPRFMPSPASMPTIQTTARSGSHEAPVSH